MLSPAGVQSEQYRLYHPACIQTITLDYNGPAPVVRPTDGSALVESCVAHFGGGGPSAWHPGQTEREAAAPRRAGPGSRCSIMIGPASRCGDTPPSPGPTRRPTCRLHGAERLPERPDVQRGSGIRPVSQPDSGLCRSRSQPYVPGARSDWDWDGGGSPN